MNRELTIKEDAPIQELEKEQVSAIIERVKASIPDGAAMSQVQLAVIAQESILYRTMPGKDIHYWLDVRGKLQSSDDYKRLVAWAISRERFLTSDPSATVEIDYKELTEVDREREHLEPQQVAAYCVITTKQEREMFYNEVKRWRELDFNPQEALELARETLGELGTKAIGIVEKAYNKKTQQEYWKIPVGWSPLQTAQKLALKNAIRRKYGQASVDEQRAITRQLARIETIDEDWENVPIDVDAEVQARQAELEAIVRQVEPGHLEENVMILRGNDDVAIGDDYE